MSNPTLKVKLVRRNAIKLRLLPRFPASIVGANGISIVSNNNIYTIQPTPGSTLALLNAANVSAASLLNSGIGALIDGGGVALSTGYQVSIPIPFNCTITGVTLLTDVVGSLQVDIRDGSFAGFPAAVSIVAAAPPAIVAAQSYRDTVLTGWRLGLTKGDILEFWVTSVSAVTKATIALDVARA